MLGVNKINYKSFFFILLVILLFKPTWLISNDSLGTGGDDLSYWIHASTLAYDYDLNYTERIKYKDALKYKKPRNFGQKMILKMLRKMESRI